MFGCWLGCLAGWNFVLRVQFFCSIPFLGKVGGVTVIFLTAASSALMSSIMGSFGRAWERESYRSTSCCCDFVGCCAEWSRGCRFRCRRMRRRRSKRHRLDDQIRVITWIDTYTYIKALQGINIMTFSARRLLQWNSHQRRYEHILTSKLVNDSLCPKVVTVLLDMPHQYYCRDE